MGTSDTAWSSAITPAAREGDAAVQTLRRRLHDVARLLDRAGAAKPGSDQSHKRVHELRVATRRAESALDVFRDTLDDDDRGRVARRLRRIRRAVAPARDLDVQIDMLAAAARGTTGAVRTTLKRLLAAARVSRREAGHPLREAAERWRGTELRRKWDKIIDRLDAPRGRTLQDAASGAACRAIQRVEKAAGEDLRSIENVHELRLKLKRLRYVMESVEVCLGSAWKKQIQPRLAAVQASLGELNDAYVFLTTLTREAENRAGGRKGVPRGLATLLRDQEHLLAQSHAAFLEQWGDLTDGGFMATLRAAVDRGEAVSDHCSREPIARQMPVGAIIEPKLAQRNGTHAPARTSGSRRRIAAIDVGTNSIRLIIAEASPDGSYRILDDEKEITRLGRGLAETGRMAADSMEHTVVTIARMRSIAEGYGAREIRVVGTSAAREARNGSTLQRLVRERTGLEMSIISGDEEAMLAYRSAARAFDLASVSGAVVDIGGGSTEIVLSAAVGGAGGGKDAHGLHARRSGVGGVIERVYSIPMGAVRLTDQFGGPERCGGKRFEEMREHIRGLLKQSVGKAPITPQLVVGTGGTLTTLAAMVLQKELGSGDGLFNAGVQGLEVGRADLRHLLEYLRKLPVKERTRVPGLSADRADIIVAGLAIIDGVLDRLGANRVRVHEGGIRDGILLGMVGSGRDSGDAGAVRRDPMRAVRRFAKSCAYEAAHARHVTTLALQIFDQLRDQQAAFKPVAGVSFGDEQRLVLEAASLLHDIGYLINYAQHHKHSYHLIVHADLPGWTTSQVQVIANIARYHRAADPKLKHRPFAMLSEQDRQVVRALSGVLRIADGLDRTHMQSVAAVRVRADRGQAFFEVAAEREPAVDVWGAVRKSGLFKEVFALEPHFDWGRTGARTPTVAAAARAAESA